MVIKHKKLAQFLIQSIPGWVESVEINKNGIKIYMKKEHINELFSYLKLHTNTKYELLMDIFGVDNLSESIRFSVYYQLLSIHYNHRIEIETNLSNNPAISSLCLIYPCANWLEREVWDLMGIFFFNHPDLRRILTDYGFKGFPLRKDFPLSGYEEIRYDDELRRIVSETVQISQEFRFFEFKNPWRQK